MIKTSETMKRVFVTGIGVVGPSGVTFHEFWHNITLCKSSITLLKHLSPPFASYYGGIIDHIAPDKYFSRRLLNKCSRFSKLALLAVNDALNNAKMDLNEIDKSQIGIFVGNNSGGWESAHQGLKTLHTEGPEYVSPFLASNWFPAAPQGHISLAYGIKGYSKSVIADRASSLLAINYATKLILNGDLELAIAGGTEAPLDEWALTFYKSSGLMADIPEYKPFSNNRNGMCLAEGAAFFILESEESIARRGAQSCVLAEIKGFGFSLAGSFDVKLDLAIQQCSRAMQNALLQSHLSPDKIDLISLDGAANEFDDSVEAQSIKKVFGNKYNSVNAFCPKILFGNTIGASGAFDLALSIAAMNHSTIPCIVDLNNWDLNCAPYRNKQAEINSAMIISRGFGNVSSVLIVSK